MTDSAAPNDPTRDDRPLAGEYVLGVLDAEARRRAAERLAADPAFARAVAEWEERLTPLAEEAAAVAPPGGIWPAIERALPARPAPAAATRRPSGRGGLWSSAPFWRWLSVGATGLAAACLVALVVVTRPGPAPPPALLAVLYGEGASAPAFVAMIDRQAGTATLVPSARGASLQQVPQLWLLPDGGKPLSLGVFDIATSSRAALAHPLLDRLAQGAILAVSLEPPGGSPTGLPTGPVVAKGRTQPL